MDIGHPRDSTSDALLDVALQHAAASCDCETQLIRIRDLSSRHCEGYYSKSAQACTWPCSITPMHAADQMDQVYEALVSWADAVIVASPIRGLRDPADPLITPTTVLCRPIFKAPSASL
jgi:multimeric flavodoxin WrbA